MKLLIIAGAYPTKKYNHIGIFEFDQAKALVEAGIEVVYAAIDVRSIRRWRKWGYESLVKDGVYIEVINVPCGRIPHKILDKISEISLSKLYKRIISKHGIPDIIHSHFISNGYIAAKLFKNSAIPLVHTEHFSGMNQNKMNEYYMNLGNNTYHYMDKVISVSKHLSNNINDKFGIKSIVIPNIVDTSIFKYILSDNNFSTFDFISVGNLLENKRMFFLINTFYEVFINNKKVRLYIYGDGPERKILEDVIVEKGLSNQVFLMGQVDRKVIAERMCQSQCFVLVSKSETFGVSYIEAMATGLPVIATKCGGPEDFVNNNNGILVRIDNKEELAEALLEMYNNSKQYNKEKISKDIIIKFSSHNITKLIVNEYKKLLRRKI